ncbi:hypothetical protein G7Z17_g3447 [Cylindrodendrum hubeiense]|uniref:DUF7708 domain-containing protein n=1 Tax=Cylindrodendrum hubeiense TaxID=595255 RepID=A0A9P5HGW7_9HYPO|nr:hypothetical protein G7Z17_g3447 [Cylindrodendrum hubeiense]
MATTDPIQSVFDSAKREFEKGLNNRALFQDILAANTINHVYDTIEELQKKQGKRELLRYLARIDPLLKCLQNYASVIDVFVQVKPDILALIWGPIRLLLLWSSETKKSFDAILNITQNLGVLLPQFQEIGKLFTDKERMTAALALFFRDMLDFYLIALKFFKLSKWQLFFDSVWPKRKAEIEVVEANIEKHSQMIRSEATIEHLREAHEARAHAFDSFKRIEESQTSQKFQSLEASLLFQLGSEEPVIQPLLTEFNQRDLKSNTKAVAELLKTAISVVGPVLVIVDAVDEIDECERAHLICILLDTLKESSEMKLCFSSRAEDEIDRIIGTQAEIIRVDKNNSGSIQSYVNHRTKQLIDKHQFSPVARSEIRSLISPVAANSKGMFLYARIVMDNIMMLNNVEEVRHELKALPEDLDAAVNHLSPGTVRLKAIKILGWVAISPAPLTLGELQQALLVGSCTDDAPTVSSLLNIVELCGPIVELKDDQPQLVHFTVLDREQESIIAAVILTNSFEVFDVWENSLEELPEDWGHSIFAGRVLVAAKNHPAMEKRLMKSVARSSLSIPQAKVLLELGANINHPRKPWRRHGLTPLHQALKKSTKEGAEFVEFLMMNGANPKYGYGPREVSWEIGSVTISKWLGVSWEDLVESTQEFREEDSDSE